MSTAPSTVPTASRTEPTTTAGRQLHASPAVKAAVQALVGELKSKSATITDARGPVAGLKESYDALMERAKQVRGRPLLYPYVGSGVGNGALVELADGSVKWDMICGIGVHFFGHSEPDLTEAALTATLSDTTVFEATASSAAAAIPAGYATAATEAELSTCSRCARLETLASGARRLRVTTELAATVTVTAGGLTLTHRAPRAMRVRWDVVTP